jgi:Ca2+-transporting ATPase
MAFVAFMVFISSNPISNIEYARTMVFTTIVGMVIFNTFNFRSLDESIFKIKAPLNKILILAVIFILLITFCVLYLPYLRDIFEFTYLGLKDWIVCLGASFSTFVFMEVIKTFPKKSKWNKNKK